MAFVIAFVIFYIPINKYVHKGSERRNLRDYNVYIKSDIIWPEYLLPTTIAIINSSSSRPVVELW